MSNNVKYIHSSDEFHHIINSTKGLVVVDWSAEWCGPCKNIFPVYAEYSNEYTGVVFLKVDVDENKDLATEFKIRAMPTFFFFKNGRKIDELQGADPSGLGTKIEKHFEKVKDWGTGHSLGGSAPPPTSNSNVNQRNNNGNDQGPPAALEPLLNSLLDMGFPLPKAAKALISTNNVGLDQAIDWIMAHPDDDGMSSNSNDNTSSNSTNDMDTTNSTNDMDTTDDTKSTNDMDSEDKPKEPELSWEEREKLIQEKIRKNKEERKRKEEEDEHQRELNRVKNSAVSTQTKRALEEKKRKDDIAAAKRKRKQELAAKREIKAKIAAAKEERMKKAGQVVVLSTKQETTKKKETNNTKKKEYTSCLLAIRLPTGNSVTQEFKPEETLRDVHNYLQRTKQISNFSLCTNYPRKSYNGSSLDISLKDAGLLPRSALTVSYS